MAPIQNFQLLQKFLGRTLRARAKLRELSTRRPDMRAATPRPRLLLAITLLTIGILLLTTNADAKITRVQITAHETPTFGGYSWPGVGQYEKIVGVAFGEIDPTNPQNAVITDIG